ncbi:SDR family NAD(P)-dependent oxidoreductase [Caldimonas thermodepolymerans]|uniref:SDR family NAD(P)-dependent oxidoreductase n=1 Tax=Caldimonas thermodepolymerans TaxID=215580 RepID=UPI002236333A|nr:SDR family oxidoreductase [Caldimonas thermodepolymerans]UZG44388.1 SDR family oxidoreductase [Caldimonas thermodepolymerans]
MTSTDKDFVRPDACFVGRTALVTGGASGIGLACVELLRAKGAHVVVADLHPEPTRTAADRHGGRALVFDVADRKAVAQARQTLEADGIEVDFLVNCAGIVQSPEPPHQFDHAEFQRVLAVDLEGTYTCCAEFGPAMARRGRGVIVNIASVAGMRSMPLMAYSPAKAAVISLTECLAAEWGRSGVRVNSVSPGYTVTAALQRQIDLGLRDPEKLKQNSALGLLIDPMDIAQAIVFLLSDQARAITGINLPVDAGWLVAGSWSTFGGVRPALQG